MATTLNEVMLEHARGDASGDGMFFWNTSSRDYDPVTYPDLIMRAYAVGARLLGAGHCSGSVCMIACHSPYATLVSFYGAISVGAIPMIFPMPRALGSHDALLERIRHWGPRFDRPAVLVLEEGVEERFHAEIPRDVPVIRVGASPLGECERLSGPALGASAAPDDVAFFQTTSSSTGDHKAVAISHGNIMANVRGIRNAVGMDDDERMVSWLPLFHDMGLVGTVLYCLCHRYPLFLMTPTQFIKRPVLWLRGMSEHGGTIATAPNFGYDYCARISDKDRAALDLSKVKHFFIGAEPIRVSTVRDFCDGFSACGVRPGMIRPAYGLAESTIITTISRPDKPARFVFLDPGSIGIGETVEVAGEARFEAAELGGAVPGGLVAACTAGTAIDGMDVEVVGDDGAPVREEGRAGEVVIRGSSVALGYVDGQPRLVDEFEDGCANTGDMGVVIGGELYIIERIKNVIIRSGENYLVNAMEQRIADLLGVSHENVAVFESDIYDPSSDIVVLVEKHRGLSGAEIDSLIARLPRESFPVDRILFSRGRAIPRTTSGKKRHFFCRRLLQEGELVFQSRIDVDPDRIAAALGSRS
jgi:acyl-CoA synthetase (AMP-forming)/AMP-acid ligase II